MQFWGLCLFSRQNAMGTVKNMGTYFLVWLLLCLGFIFCAPDGGQGASWVNFNRQLLKREDMHYCGKRLFDAVRDICRGNYAGLTRRSDPSVPGNFTIYYATPLLTPQKSKTVGRKETWFFFSASAGVYEESSDRKTPFDKLNSGLYFPTESGQDSDSENWEGGDNSLMPELDGIWPRAPKGLSYHIFGDGQTHRRLRRSINEECCKKPCGYRTMMKYCGSGSG